MNLLTIVQRTPIPEPWAEGDKIPWDDPDFSRRMLQEHLSQEHDAASRRMHRIDAHVAWIHGTLLQQAPTNVLDLACGPGLYCSRLARLGHTCTGIDFGPASVAYAKEQAELAGLACTYRLDDLRSAVLESGYGLAMLVFGEFNVFQPAVMRDLLRRVYRALDPGGILLLEPHTYGAVVGLGAPATYWHTVEQGLFSDEPYLYLRENFWNGDAQVAIERHFIIDAQTGAVALHGATIQAYTDDDYRAVLTECGFAGITFHAALDGGPGDDQPGLMAIVATKPHR